MVGKTVSSSRSSRRSSGRVSVAQRLRQGKSISRVQTDTGSRSFRGGFTSSGGTFTGRESISEFTKKTNRLRGTPNTVREIGTDEQGRSIKVVFDSQGRVRETITGGVGLTSKIIKARREAGLPITSDRPFTPVRQKQLQIFAQTEGSRGQAPRSEIEREFIRGEIRSGSKPKAPTGARITDRGITEATTSQFRQTQREKRTRAKLASTLRTQATGRATERVSTRAKAPAIDRGIVDVTSIEGTPKIPKQTQLFEERLTRQRKKSEKFQRDIEFVASGFESGKSIRGRIVGAGVRTFGAFGEGAIAVPQKIGNILEGEIVARESGQLRRKSKEVFLDPKALKQINPFTTTIRLGKQVIDDPIKGGVATLSEVLIGGSIARPVIGKVGGRTGVLEPKGTIVTGKGTVKTGLKETIELNIPLSSSRATQIPKPARQLKERRIVKETTPIEVEQQFISGSRAGKGRGTLRSVGEVETISVFEDGTLLTKKTQTKFETGGLAEVRRGRRTSKEQIRGRGVAEITKLPEQGLTKGLNILEVDAVSKIVRQPIRVSKKGIKTGKLKQQDIVSKGGFDVTDQRIVGNIISEASRRQRISGRVQSPNLLDIPKTRPSSRALTLLEAERVIPKVNPERFSFTNVKQQFDFKTGTIDRRASQVFDVTTGRRGKIPKQQDVKSVNDILFGRKQKKQSRDIKSDLLKQRGEEIRSGRRIDTEVGANIRAEADLSRLGLDQQGFPLKKIPRIKQKPRTPEIEASTSLIAGQQKSIAREVLNIPEGVDTSFPIISSRSEQKPRTQKRQVEDILSPRIDKPSPLLSTPALSTGDFGLINKEIIKSEILTSERTGLKLLPTSGQRGKFRTKKATKQIDILGDITAQGLKEKQIEIPRETQRERQESKQKQKIIQSPFTNLDIITGLPRRTILPVAFGLPTIADTKGKGKPSPQESTIGLTPSFQASVLNIVGDPTIVKGRRTGLEFRPLPRRRRRRGIDLLNLI